MQSIGSFVSLLPLFFLVQYKKWKEERLIQKRFYSVSLFSALDRSFKASYRFLNPYSISKRFLRHKGEKDIHVYGETPLTTMDQILKEAAITPEDCFLDLGSGRGRVVFFAASVFGCKAIGVEWIPRFFHIAQKIASYNKAQDKILFKWHSLIETDVTEATCVYFYAITMPDAEIARIAKLLEQGKKGMKVITVSFSLSDYSSAFHIVKEMVFPYPWGIADVFICEKI